MTFTIITNNHGVLSKRITADGTKHSYANLSDGTYRTVKVNDLNDFNNELLKLDHNMAITLGTVDNSSGLITTKDSLEAMGKNNHSHIISRSKTYFKFENESILLFDIDVYNTNDFQATSYEQIIDIIEKIDPQFKGAELLIRNSSSSNIYKNDKDGAIEVYGAGSYHVYFKTINVNNNISNYIKHLEDRAFELGYGYFKISKTGSLLKRQVFDSSVFSPERLVFESGMICEYPYEQKMTESFFRKGEYIDCTKLPTINNEILETNILLENNKVSKEAEEIKKQYKEAYIDNLVDLGHSEIDAKRKIEIMISDNILCSSHKIQLLNNKIIQVKDIFLNPNTYNNVTCCDPLEPEKGIKAIIYSNNGENPIISSFLHGGVAYKLDVDSEVIKEIASGATFNSDTNELLIKRILILAKKADLNVLDRIELGRILKNKKIATSIDVFKMSKEDMVQIAKDKGYVDFMYNLNTAPTIENLIIMMQNNHITYQYDVIKKIPLITHHSIDIKKPNYEEAIVSYLESCAIKDNIDISILKHIPALGNSINSNPLMEHIMESHKVYVESNEKINYIKQVAQVLNTSASFKYTEAVLTKWFIQCIAAWDYSRNYTCPGAKEKFESVLVLQSHQGVQKTKFFNSLFTNKYTNYIKTGAMLNPSDKDSLIQNTQYAIVELGELDSTFNKSDIGALKAFLSNSFDEYRVPYGKVSCKHKRCTSYCASVNESGFLRDSTGARRFFIIPLQSLDFVTYETIDKDMLWAQAYDLYISGVRWWFDETDTEVNKEMAELHNTHRAYSLADELFTQIKENHAAKKTQLTATKIFEEYNVERFTKKDVSDFINILNANGFFHNARKEYKIPAYEKNSKYYLERKSA